MATKYGLFTRVFSKRLARIYHQQKEANRLSGRVVQFEDEYTVESLIPILGFIDTQFEGHAFNPGSMSSPKSIGKFNMRHQILMVRAIAVSNHRDHGFHA